MAIIKVVCPDCGSDNVTRDACARWSVQTQDWILSTVYDDITCNDCGRESFEFGAGEPKDGRWIEGEHSTPLSPAAIAKANADDAEPVPPPADLIPAG